RRLPSLAAGAGRRRLRRRSRPRGGGAAVVKLTATDGAGAPSRRGRRGWGPARAKADANDPDALAHLEEEREFLLRSLRDLEREREAGDIEDGDYRTLRDDYTVRAASVLRAIDEGRAQLPAPRRRRPRRVVATVAAVVAVAVGAGVLVARASGERVAGRPGSGSLPTGEADQLAQARAALNQ